MRRSRTEGSKRRRCVATALAFGIVALALGCAGPGRAETQLAPFESFSSAKLQRVGDLIRQEIAAGKMPGAIILIQQHGHPVYFECFGVRDVESRHPMTPDSIFRIYSMSKPITSVAAMMLIEDGKLALEDPVGKYIPAFADVKVGIEKKDENGKPVLVPEPLARPITIKDLLRHTSGLTYGFYGDTLVRKLYANSGLFEDDPDNAAFAERIAKLPLAEQPATRWDYGHSTDVLGRVIEVISGQTLYAFEKQRLLDPLGMSETAFFVADPAQRLRIAQPMPDDPFDRPLAGIKDPTLPRRWESGGARHGRDHRGLRPLRANAAERRYAGRLALSQARNYRADGVGPHRAGNQNRPRPVLFSRRDQRIRSWLCGAHLGTCQYFVAARRISVGWRRRDVLFHRSARRYVCDLVDPGAVAGRTNSTAAEDADL